MQKQKIFTFALAFVMLTSTGYTAWFFGVPTPGANNIQSAGRIMQALFGSEAQLAFNNSPWGSIGTSTGGGVFERLNWIQTNLAGAVPVGTVSMFAGEVAPDGYLICDGSAVSRATYPNLHNVLKDAVGPDAYVCGAGDGTTTFNLPDMRGASPGGAGISVGYLFNEQILLGAKIDDTIQALDVTNSNYGIIYAPSLVAALTTGGGSYGIGPQDYSVVDGGHGAPRFGPVTKGKTIGINFIIKY